MAQEPYPADIVGVRQKNHAINVTLIVKADSPEEAEEVVRRRLDLAEWLCEDMHPPYQHGSLLWYRVHARAVPKEMPPQIKDPSWLLVDTTNEDTPETTLIA